MSDETTDPLCESENPLDHIGDEVPDPFEHPADVVEVGQAVSNDGA